MQSFQEYPGSSPTFFCIVFLKSVGTGPYAQFGSREVPRRSVFFVVGKSFFCYHGEYTENCDRYCTRCFSLAKVRSRSCATRSRCDSSSGP